LRYPVVEAGYYLERRLRRYATGRDPDGCHLCPRLLRWRLHDELAGCRYNRREGVDCLLVRQWAPADRARRPCSPARSASVPVEERQVGPRPAAASAGGARLLGDARLP